MKKRIFSGIQPSGNLHIGNYLGAIKNWVKLQDEYDSIFCVVDMHAITVPQDPEELKKKTIEVAKIYLASGINPEKCSLFVQSHIPEHAELCWILNTITKNGDLTKMTQFKDKAGLDLSEFEEELNFLEGSFNRKDDLIYDKKEMDIDEFETAMAGGHRKVSQEMIKEIRDKFRESVIIPLNTVSVGLFDYPVLMAADILLYDTNLVPVGKDQLQHIEIARTLANRFNKKFGNTFMIPEPYTTKESENIMGLDDPSKKMSKSAASAYNYISLTDDPETVRQKIKKAVTDSGSEIVYQDSKPALKNLINIYSLLSEKSTKDIEKQYEGKNYSDFKNDLADVVVSFLDPFQRKMQELSDEKVLEILRQGAEKVRPIARKKLGEIKKRIGFVIN